MVITSDRIHSARQPNKNDYQFMPLKAKEQSQKSNSLILNLWGVFL
jgi:hypothetical protein